ncbi:zinc ribbon domain-containing protein [Candidatus Collinsella stercoripullorum]|uniref:zinc ribbon domain-containing protein n=1 Tax=Candidatus Collinsella stercoripullorum TaxID=2838522 RepID=UPI0022E18000|nr:zinc ribbon domain-containing protein [Candidatus Collinsella stercoripullorum]
MTYCNNCGGRLMDGASFCTSCGAPVQSQRVNRYAGVIVKCPVCGEILESFDAFCPSCGSEIRGVQGVSSLNSLMLQLQAAENHPSSGRRKGLLERFNREPSKEDEWKASLIRSFPIPNTKEDLLEFIIVSASNINADAFNEVKYGTLPPSEVALSRAWASKLEQAYQKAQIVLEHDEDFAEIAELYEKTAGRIEHARKGAIRLYLGVALLWIAMIAIIIVLCLINSALSSS